MKTKTLTITCILLAFTFNSSAQDKLQFDKLHNKIFTIGCYSGEGNGLIKHTFTRHYNPENKQNYIFTTYVTGDNLRNNKEDPRPFMNKLNFLYATTNSSKKPDGLIMVYESSATKTINKLRLSNRGSGIHDRASFTDDKKTHLTSAFSSSYHDCGIISEG